jgi:hypothetical protein
MPSCMESIYDKQCISEKMRFSCHTIWAQSTGKVIDDPFRRGWPTSDYRRKNIIVTLSSQDAVEAIAYIKLQWFKNDMQCSVCGPTPNDTIWDGVTLSFS